MIYFQSIGNAVQVVANKEKRNKYIASYDPNGSVTHIGEGEELTSQEFNAKYPIIFKKRNYKGENPCVKNRWRN